jgi:outer membrane cobalamin receptor
MVIGGVVGEIEQLSNGYSITSSTSEVTSPPKPSKPPVLNNYIFSYYLQIELKIYNQLSFIGGFRQDFSSYYGQVFTPRMGFVFNRNKLTAKIQYNNAFRAPKPWDYNYGVGNANLKPEKMHSFELFCSYAFTDNISIGSSIYKYLINDILINDTTDNNVRWINENELNTWGAEFYVNYSIRAFSIYANYTYNNSFDQDNTRIPEISMHTANAGVTYTFNSHVKVNVRTNYLGERENPFEIPNTGNKQIDNALLLHTCISYFDFKGLDFQFKVNNLLNKEYYHPSNLIVGRYRQPQQTFLILISYNF